MSKRYLITFVYLQHVNVVESGTKTNLGCACYDDRQQQEKTIRPNLNIKSNDIDLHW